LNLYFSAKVPHSSEFQNQKAHNNLLFIEIKH
jgi:hypothetical protein